MSFKSVKLSVLLICCSSLSHSLLARLPQEINEVNPQPAVPLSGAEVIELNLEDMAFLALFMPPEVAENIFPGQVEENPAQPEENLE